MKRSSSAGFAPISLILNAVFVVLILLLGGFAIWAFMNYQDYKNNVDTKVSDAVKTAKTEQQKADQVTFAEQEKLPTRQLAGPQDLGGVTLNYPKTWSVYISNNGTGGQFEALLYPGAVPAISTNTPYALRVSVVDSPYEAVVKTFEAAVKSGDLKATAIKAEDGDGLRLDGKFSATVSGSMAVFKVRDKTLRILTETPTFKNDFDTTVLPSLRFNK